MSVAMLELPRGSVWQVGGPQGDSLRARRMALGLTVKALAEKAGVDRSRVTAAEEGTAVRSSTLGAIEAALVRLEEEMSGPYDTAVTNVIELPDGTKVTFVGSADNVVEAATRFLSRRHKS